MGSNPSQMSNVKTINVETARDDSGRKNKGQNLFDSPDQKDEETNVAYRDADSNVKLYRKESVPVVWIPKDSSSVPTDVQSVKQLYVNKDETSASKPDRQPSAKTSKSEGHRPKPTELVAETEDKPEVKEGFVSPENIADDNEESDLSNRAEGKESETKLKEQNTSKEYTLFRDGTFIQGSVKTTGTGFPDFKPPSITRRDLIPDDDMFEDIDEHVLQTPTVVQEDMSTLVTYLTEPACTPLDEVRAFYMWITHNINYDTSGYFGRSKLLSTDPESVLKTRVTVCEGYTKLFDVFCKIVAIPSKIIRGYVKGFGYHPGDDVTNDAHNAHMWNAVYVENNWFFIDVTLGAGYVKSKEKTYVAKFNPLYFICDPSTFICDHFPYVKGDARNEVNQLLQKPVTFKEFNSLLNMEKCGKQWGIETISHATAVIDNIKFELDIQLQQTFVPMSDYLAFMYRDGAKTEQYTYTHKPDLRTVNIHVIMPKQGEHVLQIYGRRKQDPPDSNLEPLVRYILKCKMAFDNPTPYPNHHTCYGLMDEPEKYGLADVGNVLCEGVNGEAILKLKPSQDAKSDCTDILPRLFYGDHTTELKTQTFVEYSQDFEHLIVRARLPFLGYFKLLLFGKTSEGSQIKPFMTYLIENKKVVNEEGFPTVHAHALKYKCHLQEPLRRKLAYGQNYLVLVNIKSPLLAKVKAHVTELTKSDDATFEGLVSAPKHENSNFVIYGADKVDESYHPLYTCTMIPGNVLSVPSAIS